jgi:hypothetical protein
MIFFKYFCFVRLLYKVVEVILHIEGIIEFKDKHRSGNKLRNCLDAPQNFKVFYYQQRQSTNKRERKW